MKVFHISRAVSEVIHQEGLRPDKCDDGYLYFSRTLDDARKWWITLNTQQPLSIWQVDIDENDCSTATYRVYKTALDVKPSNLILLYEGTDPPWLQLDPAAHGLSIWHKDTPETFWERMRLLHGEDVGPDSK